MHDTASTAPAIIIRLASIVVLVSLYEYWPVATLGLEMLDHFAYRYRYEEIMSVDLISAGWGMLNIITWLLGLLTAITLFMLKTCSRWLLLAYFLVGLFPAQIAWIPYAGYIMTLFEDPYMKLISPELVNLLVVIITFIMFRKVAGLQDAHKPASS